MGDGTCLFSLSGLSNKAYSSPPVFSIGVALVGLWGRRGGVLNRFFLDSSTCDVTLYSLSPGGEGVGMGGVGMGGVGE